MLAPHLRDPILKYVRHEITLDELEEWIASRLRPFVADPQSEDAALAATVELGLAELSDDLLTEKEFRRTLIDAIEQYETVIPHSADAGRTLTMSFSSSKSEPPTTLKIDLSADQVPV